MKKKRQRVTLQQVAEHAGVSRATASLIVRNSPNISEPTRKKVLESMRELGYVYDRVAANLRSQRSNTIGLIITDVANPFFAELLVGVHHTLEADGYTVILGTTFDLDHKQEQLLSTMLEHRVGGVILCPVSKSDPETLNRLAQWDIPIVLAVREIPGVEYDYVGINYKAGTEMALNHLIKKGHRRIAFLGGLSESSAWQARKQGYCHALEQAGIEIDESLIVESAAAREGGAESINVVLQNQNPPTAVFCFNDLVAFGVMEGLREKGLTPGKDIDVVGFDNVREAALTNPSLTTISSFARLIGSNAAELLHKRILNSELERKHIILEPELEVRDSTGSKG
ncbi:LacI family DNA-binding transcriptional regulator [Halalkalibacter urbisdiaboli]|uniref:LacI family DNA-binding transcriptional regulator n=1 Tax=Halalkalibacter urbisdiaboli TaxID=1960589 RepID=UPI000B436334|nr:LacI family DNA-binding transcriptional regulator [Halalkalibacter urbisdiaboli]